MKQLKSEQLQITYKCSPRVYVNIFYIIIYFESLVLNRKFQLLVFSININEKIVNNFEVENE